MSKVIKLTKGLDIKLLGEASKRLVKLPNAAFYALVPDNFVGVTPKVLVRQGDSVKAGTALFFDKQHPQVLFTSPVSGKISAINRGDKRKLLSIVIEADIKIDYEQFECGDVKTISRENVIETLLKSGLWSFLIQRPYGIIASSEDTPKAIFVSGFDSSPLAPDMAFVLEGEQENLKTGFEILRKLTDGEVHLSLRLGDKSRLSEIDGVSQHRIKGMHPAGNVGVQIHHIDPINKGEVVWTVDIQNLAIIGRLFNRGVVDMTKTIALTGSELADTYYVSIIGGAQIGSIIRKSTIRPQEKGDNVRIISGNVLTGVKVEVDDYIGYYTNQITVIPEGDKYQLFGWAMARFGKFSVSRSYFSWLMPKKQYTLDTNLNGGVRPFVVTGLYDRYLPMDIYPMYLLKAILAGNIDRMESLGIYEVVEEDLALCEFADPSKIEIQQIVRDGIDLIIKELN